jgi:hypothetical protein
MRLLVIAVAFAIAAAPSASAQTGAPSAQALYVERRALLETDAQCSLFSPNIRAALQAGAGQAAGALLRSGWTRARLNELEHAAVSAARTRACGDPRSASAARAAEAGFTSWVRTYAMNFRGAERLWTARRSADVNGWRLSQPIAAPIAATFGVREHEGAQQLALVMPLAAGEGAPSSVQLVMRDPARASTEMLDLRGRTASGLAAGLPPPGAVHGYFANSRRVEANREAPNQAVFTFPEAAFQSLLRLDPRETAELRLETEGQAQRILIEVGDLAAARAFLAISAES